jgi:mono/diheme cytochrome c family protein
MRRTAIRLFIGACAAGMLAGCATSATSTADKADSASLAGLEGNQSGAQLWAENCARCHNLRAPGSYSDAQWDIAAMHMRERANLTGYEERAILKFLKSAN